MREAQLFYCHIRCRLLTKIIIFGLLVSVTNLFSQPLANGHSKFLGCTINFTIPGNWNTYWNQVTTENGGKWGMAEPSRDSYSWGSMDLAYGHALARGYPFKIHTLIWGQQSPDWIMALDSAQQAAEIEEWIRDVGARYPQAAFVDVVNEPLATHAPAPYRNALGGSGDTGYDWVIRAFELARQYFNPAVKLILNEYNVLNSNDNTTEFLKIINLLKDRELIDAIGVQGHYFELRDPTVAYMDANLDRMAATGLPIYISEYEINLADDTEQLLEYQRIFPLLWEHPGVKGITLWGFNQGEIWQVNGYLVRSNGTERPALEWLRSYLLGSGAFRSHQSGAWNDTTSWERYNGTEWVHPAPITPTYSDQTITLFGGDTITVTVSDSADQMTINSGGVLVINEGVTFKVKEGNETDLTMDGVVWNYGSISLADSATIRFRSGGRYIHAQDGGTIPEVMWSSGSTCQLDSIQVTLPANIDQNFYNLTWNCIRQSAVLNLDWDGNTIGGNITVQNTGSGRLQMCAPETDDSAVVTINGGIIQSGGEFTATGTDNGGTKVIITQRGNINVTGGNFSVSQGTQGGTGSTVWNLLGSSFSMSNAYTENLTSSAEGAKFVFSAAGTQSLNLGSGNTIISLPVEVSSVTTLNMGSSVLGGSGIFILNNGATLECGHTNGLDGAITTSGVKVFSKSANYTFNGTAAQVTGTQLPDTVVNLTLNNSAGVTLSGGVVVNGRLELKNGALSLNGNVLSYGPEGVLKYSGSTAQTTSDAEFPVVNGPKDLLIGNPNGITLHASRQIAGKVDLLGKLRVGINTFTAASTTNESSYRFVVTTDGGMLRLISVGTTQKLFPVGVATYAPVWITNNGTVDTIGVSVVDDATPAAEGGRVKVRWDITESTAGDGDYTLQFGWMPTLEDATLKADRLTNAKIFEMIDTTEAGSGMYTTQFTSQPYYVSRGGITVLGPFAVGRFGYVDEITMPVAEVTREFNLSQNYPNPFNPTTTIRYTLGQSCQVKLLVYNVLGAQVRTLVNNLEQSGPHTVVWDARDEQNNPVASGIYFYQLVTEEQSIQKKMLLVR